MPTMPPVRFALLGLMIQMLFILCAWAYAASAIAAENGIQDTGPFPARIATIAEQLAEDYIAEHHMPDACADRPITALLATNLDQIMGRDVDGMTYLHDCTFYGDGPAITANPTRMCNVAVHERLHLARGDDWHNTTDPHDPLYTGDSDGDGRPDSGLGYPPCLTAFEDPSFTWAMARRAIRTRLRHADRWRLDALDWTQSARNLRRLTTVRFEVLSRGRQARRVYVVTRPETAHPVRVSRRR